MVLVGVVATSSTPHPVLSERLGVLLPANTSSMLFKANFVLELDVT